MNPARDYGEFFRGLTGRIPYDYQTRVAQRLEETGEHLLLTAPTGCGKTWATLAPFLHARSQGRPFADRVIYALPLRALANSLKAATEQSLRNVHPSIRVTLQTGAEPQDETFDHGDIVFTTIDQVLSSYLHMPLSLPRRLANLNAGAIVGALVVFDEAHLLDPTHALRTMLHLIESHGTLARFVIATATFTSKARQLLLEHVPGMRQEGPTPSETTAIPALATRRRSWTRVGEAVSAEAVRRLHRGDRTIVVVNSVRKAQDIAASLLREPPEGARILVLHSRFFAEDRASTEAKLAAIFGPDADTTNAILVATQVVEAGMDLSADRLLTEIAPGNALVQRAGRCARYVAPRNTGDILVFDLDRDGHGKRRLGPYRNGDDRSCLEAAWNALDHTEHAVLGGEGETRLLEASMADSECRVFTTALSQAEIRRRREEVQRAWGEGDLSALRLLVRDVRSVSVLLSDNPEAVSITDGPETISLPTVAWLGFVREVESQGSLRLVRVLEEQADVESPRCVRWTWREMQTPDDWADAYCVQGSLAGYHPMMGLLLSPSVGPLPAVRYRHRRPVVAFHYAYETYHDHVTRVLRQAHEWLRRHPVAVESCAKYYQVRRDLIESIVLLAAGLHDVAKLDRAWQAAGRAWQAHKGRPVSEVGLIRFRGQVGYVVPSLVSMLSRARADVTAAAPCAAWA